MYQECSRHIDWPGNSYQTVPHYKQTNSRLMATESTCCLPKSTRKVPVICRWKQASIGHWKQASIDHLKQSCTGHWKQSALAAESKHWPFKAASIGCLKQARKQASIGHWKQASIDHLKQSCTGHWKQSALAAESKPALTI